MWEGQRRNSPAPPPAPPAVGSTKHEDRHDKAIAAPVLKLDVTIDGAPATWDKSSFDKVAHFVGKNNDGEARDVWSLRELAHQLAGANARVASVVGAEATMSIDAAAWADPARTPILHTTRRGNLKFRWTDKDGAWLETAVKDVTKLELVTH